MKKHRIVILCIAVILAVAVIAGIVFIAACMQPPSVRSIDVKSGWSDDITLVFKQVGCSGYSVKNLDKEEHIHIYEGERVLEYFDDLGDYRVKIVFSDIKSCKKLEQQFAPGETHVIEAGGTKFKLMWHTNTDHGVDIFIGSEENFSVEDVPFTKLKSSPFKTVKITLTKGN